MPVTLDEILTSNFMVFVDLVREIAFGRTHRSNVDRPPADPLQHDHLHDVRPGHAECAGHLTQRTRPVRQPDP